MEQTPCVAHRSGCPSNTAQFARISRQSNSGFAPSTATITSSSQIKMIGSEAKALKRTICEEWIYPPVADGYAAFAAADPALSVVA
jgi:hypothetical protein